MIISYKWCLDYLQLTEEGNPVVLSPERMAEILTEVGLEVENIIHYEAIPGSLEGLVIGEVLSVAPHPDADRLQLTTVNVGQGDPLPIVCGAPNVAAGQKVVVATVGSTIHPVKGEPFTIKKAKIRGQASAGMICAEDEIGLGQDHSGIMVLEKNAPVGQSATTYFQPYNDWQIEVALTPNRADAMSHIGVALDIVAYLQVNSTIEAQLKLPPLGDIPPPQSEKPITVTIEDAAACPRYTGLVLDQLSIAPSPTWLQNRLQAIGVKPINNVVDITNFVLHEWGQPLHAFDYDAIDGAKIVVKTLEDNTPFTTLDEQKRLLSAEDLMICNAHSGMCIAGVYGGKDSGVTAATRTMFLESAHFDAVHIRNTALRHNLRTDAAMHFEKGLDPNLTLPALQRAIDLLCQMAGAQVASPLHDFYPHPVLPSKVTLTQSYIDTLAGMTFSSEKVHTILEAMGMEVEQQGDAYHVTVPTYKTEVYRPADVMEELLRVYGYNNIPIPETMHLQVSTHAAPDVYRHRERLLQWLAHSGYLECQSLSFLSANQLQKAGMKGENWATVANPLSAELDILRPDILYSMLQVVAHNLNHRNESLALAELGRTYTHQDQKYQEHHQLVLVRGGTAHTDTWEAPSRMVDYYDIKRTIVHLLSVMHIKDIKWTATDDERLAYGQQLQKGRRLLGVLGAVAPHLLQAFHIKKPVFVAILDVDYLEQLADAMPLQYREVPRYPAMQRDLALVLDKGISYSRLEAEAVQYGGPFLESVHLFDSYSDKKLGENKISYAIRFTFRKNDSTLTDKPVDKVMKRLMERYTQEFKATIRQ